MARQNGTEAVNGSGGSGALRPDRNDKFAQTSFLYGGNAAYVEQLQADFERDPNAVDPEWRAFFAQLNDDRAAVESSASGPHWRKPNWPPARQWRTRFRARRRLGPNAEALKPVAKPNEKPVAKPNGGAVPSLSRHREPSRRRPPTCSGRRAIPCAR